MGQISIKKVDHRFEREGREPLQSLRDINLEVGDCEFICLLGPSGCGKTTLLRTIGGLLKTSAGTIEIDGVKVKRPIPQVSVVFQSDSLLPWRNVVSNVELGLELQHKEKDRDQTMRLVQMAGLAGFENYYPHELSGGMRQRVNLLRALATNPEVLLMDEPFAALDAQTREIMQMGLLSIWERLKRTVVFVTHQIDEAVYLADRVIVMDPRPGRIKADIKINFPRPRNLDIKRTYEFTEIVEQVWELIRQEVLAAGGWADFDFSNKLAAKR